MGHVGSCCRGGVVGVVACGPCSRLHAEMAAPASDAAFSSLARFSAKHLVHSLVNTDGAEGEALF
eukprot:scaffold234524_cov35-Tisochrysis_lutea.AAC.4